MSDGGHSSANDSDGSSGGGRSDAALETSSWFRFSEQSKDLGGQRGRLSDPVESESSTVTLVTTSHPEIEEDALGLLQFIERKKEEVEDLEKKVEECEAAGDEAAAASYSKNIRDANKLVAQVYGIARSYDKEDCAFARVEGELFARRRLMVGTCAKADEVSKGGRGYHYVLVGVRRDLPDADVEATLDAILSVRASEQEKDLMLEVPATDLIVLVDCPRCRQAHHRCRARSLKPFQPRGVMTARPELLASMATVSTNNVYSTDRRRPIRFADPSPCCSVTLTLFSITSLRRRRRS